MAEGDQEVLELEDAPEVETEDEIEEQEGNEVEEPEADKEEPEGDETFIGFEGEEDAAPASEGDSDVIRTLRDRNRELVKRNRELERSAKPAKVEVGEKPTLESCEYDEERFETELDAWKGRKAKAEAQQAEAAEAEERSKTEWAERAQAYDADKVKLGVADYDDAEAEVFSALSSEAQALLLMSDKPAALVYALHRSPTKLEELSKLNLARAAMMIGKMEDKVTIRKRKAPAPDTPIKGKTTASGDKQLKRLEEKAAKTGDRTELIRYKKQLKAQA